MFGLGPTELVIILAIALIIFGPSKLPEIGKSIGKGINEFKNAANDVQEATNIENNDSDKAKKEE